MCLVRSYKTAAHHDDHRPVDHLVSQQRAGGSRLHCSAGRPPLPAFHAGAGSVGSMTCHSASLMSDGYGTRVLRLMPPRRQRHGTAEVPRGCAAPPGPLVCTNRDHRVRAHVTPVTTRPRRVTGPLYPLAAEAPRPTAGASASRQALTASRTGGLPDPARAWPVRARRRSGRRSHQG